MQNSLNSKLDNAANKLESGQVNAAVNQLQAFINQVEAQRGKKISEAAADDLIAQAQAIIAQLTPTPTPTPVETITPSPTPLAYLPENVFAVSLKLPALLKVKADYLPYQQNSTVIIDYAYDPLYRLTSADYSTGDFYHYSYDSVGNRLTEETQLATKNYAYDSANRLSSVDGVNYTFDANGNLLNDGQNSYVYDSANRLISVNATDSYSYNGLGDRLTQNGVQYALDLNAGLTQVLDDGENTYLYGLGRISQTNTSTEYFLGDALGSVRQLTAGNGDVTLAKSYNPYGEVLSSNGSGTSPFAYTGEQTDPNGLVYLRARYYGPQDGRFLSRDTWAGDVNSPLSFNRWNYVEGNPINYFDPSGSIRQSEVVDAGIIVNELKIYNVFVRVDWGTSNYYNNISTVPGVSPCGWQDGHWSLWELAELRKGVIDLSRAMGGLNKFVYNFGYISVLKEQITGKHKNAIAVATTHKITVNTIYNNKFNRWSAVHELGHVWDGNFGWNLSEGLVTSAAQYSTNQMPAKCDPEGKLPGCNDIGYVYNGVLAHGSGASMTPKEDFANSVAAYVYPVDTQLKIQKYKGTKYEKYLYYDDYRTTMRWLYIDTLINVTNSHRK